MKDDARPMPLTMDEVRTRALPLINPIDPAAPAGKAANFEPAFEAVTTEMATLESPTGSPVDWARVLDQSQQILKTQSKDLRIASYLAYALYEQKELAGLCEGLVVVTGLLEQYWQNLYPELTRLRARSNALTWLLERA